MKISILENKKIVILGLGITGFETAEVLEEYKDNIIIIDNNFKNRHYEILKMKNYKIVSENEFLETEYKIDIILKSPGVPFNNKILLKYNSSLIINDIELAYLFIKENNLNTKIIGITGTNGKTSTVLFLEKLLLNAEKNVEKSGNIGVSPLKKLENSSNNLDFLLMELSSFQLKSIEKFKPDFAFLLNIFPDHLNMHPSYEDYINSKKKIFLNQTSENYFFYNEEISKFIKDDKIASLKIKNEISEEIKIKIMDSKNYSINYNNLCLCYNFSQIINIPEQIFFKTLEEFSGIEHRMEYLKTIEGVSYYNDSKATNLEAMKEGINKLSNIILLVGGMSKGEDFSEFALLLNNVKYVVCYGENKEKFSSPKILDRVVDLETAFEIANKVAKPGDNILLSPASASYDQFSNYEERGKRFKNLVNEME